VENLLKSSRQAKKGALTGNFTGSSFAGGFLAAD
jgi:hypothetical protein